MASYKKKNKKKSKKSECPEEHLCFFEGARDYTHPMFRKGTKNTVVKECIKGAGGLVSEMKDDLSAAKILYTDSTNHEASQLKLQLQRQHNAPNMYIYVGNFCWGNFYTKVP